MLWSKRQLTQNYVLHQGDRGTCSSYITGWMIYMLWKQKNNGITDDVLHLIIAQFVDVSGADSTDVEVLHISKPEFTIRDGMKYYHIRWGYSPKSIKYVVDNANIYGCVIKKGTMGTRQKARHCVLLDECYKKTKFGAHNTWGNNNKYITFDANNIFDLFKFRIDIKEIGRNDPPPILMYNTLNHNVIAPILSQTDTHDFLYVLQDLESESDMVPSICDLTNFDASQFVIPLCCFNLYKRITSELLIIMLAVSELIKAVGLLCMDSKTCYTLPSASSNAAQPIKNMVQSLRKYLCPKSRQTTTVIKLAINALRHINLFEFIGDEKEWKTKLSSTNILVTELILLYKYLPKMEKNNSKLDVEIRQWMNGLAPVDANKNKKSSQRIMSVPFTKSETTCPPPPNECLIKDANSRNNSSRTLSTLQSTLSVTSFDEPTKQLYDKLTHIYLNEGDDGHMEEPLNEVNEELNHYNQCVIFNKKEFKKENENMDFEIQFYPQCGNKLTCNSNATSVSAKFKSFISRYYVIKEKFLYTFKKQTDTFPNLWSLIIAMIVPFVHIQRELASWFYCCKYMDIFTIWLVELPYGFMYNILIGYVDYEPTTKKTNYENLVVNIQNKLGLLNENDTYDLDITKPINWLKLNILFFLCAVLISCLSQPKMLWNVLQMFLEWMRNYIIRASFIFISLYEMCDILVLSVAFYTMGAGFVYCNVLHSMLKGICLSTFIVFISELIFSTIAFLAARYLLRKTIKTIGTVVKKHGLKETLLFGMSPVISYNLFNYFMGLTSVGFIDYTFASVRILPNFFISCLIGVSSHHIYQLSQNDIMNNISLLMITIVGIVLTVCIIFYMKRFIKKELAKMCIHMKREQDILSSSSNGNTIGLSSLFNFVVSIGLVTHYIFKYFM